MLKTIMSHIPNYPPLSLPKWNNLTRDIKNRQDIFTLRYLNTELGDYPNVTLIENILKNCQDIILTVLSMKDNFNRCVYLMEPNIRLFVEQACDNIRNKSFFKKTFFTHVGGKSIIELIVPVMERDPLNNLPLMNYELSAWSEIKPVKLWYYDSLELVSSLTPDPRIKFKNDFPSQGIITIDFIALILKFVNYLENTYTYEVSDEILRLFMKEEVLIHLHKDLIDVWLFNLVEEVISCETTKQLDNLNDYYKSNALYFSDLGNYFTELFNRVSDMKEGKLNSIQLLNSNLLFERSILDRAKENLNSIRVRDLRQYKHNQLAIDIPNIKMLIRFIKYNKSKQLQRTVRILVERKIVFMNNSNYMNQFHSITIRNWVKSELSEIKFILDSFD